MKRCQAIIINIGVVASFEEYAVQWSERISGMLWAPDKAEKNNELPASLMLTQIEIHIKFTF